MDHQITIDEYLQERGWSKDHPKPCECGNTDLYVDILGNGIPFYANSLHPIYNSHRYRIICRKCFRMGHDDNRWLGGKNEWEAWHDWNYNPRYMPSEDLKSYMVERIKLKEEWQK